MATIEPTDHLSIVERMSRLRMRIYLEKASGICVTDKEAFLELCQQQETSEYKEEGKLVVVSSAQREGNGSGGSGGDGGGWTQVPPRISLHYYD